jgi:hypothetical protein
MNEEDCQHEWRLRLHTDYCHEFVNSYACSRCMATAVVRQERAPLESQDDLVMMLPTCARCAELTLGAKVRRAVEMEAPGVRVLHQEETWRDQERA